MLGNVFAVVGNYVILDISLYMYVGKCVCSCGTLCHFKHQFRHVCWEMCLQLWYIMSF